ncbi:glycosyltransferase family 2 protein [Seonamhaeicola sp.]|uniref:glycosyltransferase family 2 protein n=1 Tax=Seonamhaeicola sp. TaxID=1912245 RepID=UPI00261F90AB|nr:glycosyltransferase family 2 protein [Seonamhaeicola sp.]
MPLISVVLPVYNVETYISDAITSVLNQTIQDFEIIVIDDCSTDNTLSVVKSFEDSRIRIIEKPKNKGLIDSLNMGFSEAEGQFIARMDGDDINVLNRFEKQLKILQNRPDIKACGCWLQCFGASSKIIKHKREHEQIQAQLLLGNPMSLGATMLNREAYKAYNFDASKEHAEDYDFWARSAWDCKMYNIQEVLYHYRTHQDQVSSLYNDIQKNQDIGIKLSLYHKIGYDKTEFSDAFLKKMLFSNEQISITDCKQFFKWLSQISRVNKKQQIFGHKELLDVVEQLKRKFVFDIFFTNNREGIHYETRKQILGVLPFKQKLFIVRKKLKERVSLLRKREVTG